MFQTAIIYNIFLVLELGHHDCITMPATIVPFTTTCNTSSTGGIEAALVFLAFATFFGLVECGRRVANAVLTVMQSSDAIDRFLSKVITLMESDVSKYISVEEKLDQLREVFGINKQCDKCDCCCGDQSDNEHNNVQDAQSDHEGDARSDHNDDAQSDHNDDQTDEVEVADD